MLLLIKIKNLVCEEEIMDIKNMHHMNGIYEAELKLKTAFFENSKLKDILKTLHSNKGNVQIGKYDGNYVLLFTYLNNEQILINLIDIRKNMREQTRGNKHTRIRKHNIKCYWQGQSVNCSIKLTVPGGAFGKRLRRLGFDVKIIDGGGEPYTLQSENRYN